MKEPLREKVSSGPIFIKTRPSRRGRTFRESLLESKRPASLVMLRWSLGGVRILGSIRNVPFYGKTATERIRFSRRKA